MKMNSVEDLVTQSIKKRSNNTSVESESVFGEGKLLIELKIAKDGTGEEVKENTEDRSIERLVHEEYQIMSKNSDKHSVCHLCNKTFASGKALGGHMRIHTQKGMKKKNLIFKNKLKAHQSVKFKKQNPRAEEDRRETDSVKKSPSADNCAGAADTDERRACPVCQRVFPSWKSVFGHMRKHSDRKWRGISPPSIEKTNSGSCLSEEKHKNGDQDELLSISGKDGGVDLTAYSRGWTSTARRGRKRLSLERDDFQLKELEAAATLMLLKGLDFVSGFVHRQKGDELEDVKTKLEVGEPSSIGGRDLLEEKILIKNKKKRKRLKLSDLQLQPQNAASQIEETKENGVGRSRNFQEIDLNKLPPSEFEVEAPLMLGRRALKLL